MVSRLGLLCILCGGQEDVDVLTISPYFLTSLMTPKHSMIPVSSLDFDWSLVARFSIIQGLFSKKILGFKWILTAQLPNVQGFLKALFSNVQGFICRIPAE